MYLLTHLVATYYLAYVPTYGSHKSSGGFWGCRALGYLGFFPLQNSFQGKCKISGLIQTLRLLVEILAGLTLDRNHR